VPESGAVLIAANHSSYLDPPLVGGSAARPVHFLAKAELFDVPFLGWLIRGLNSHPIRRGASDPGAIRTAVKILADGHALLVFPEGTRGPEGALREPKGGVGMLAALSGAPVVPVYVQGSGRAWPRGAKLPRPARITVTFGPPLRFRPADGSARRECYEAASREIMAAIARLRDSVGVGPESRQGQSPAGAVGVGGTGGARPATK
jgi:1-acyl-sn-glycerol-3-phosphate acyltransferase